MRVLGEGIISAGLLELSGETAKRPPGGLMVNEYPIQVTTNER